MARGDLSTAALLRRIRESANELAVHFPPARTGPSTAGPATRPVSPLTGARPASSITAPEPAGESDALTIKCLWLDAPSTQVSRDGVDRPAGGWLDGADAMARVAWADAMVDQGAPEKGSWFDRAFYVLFRGLRWRVVKTEPMGAGFRAPHTLTVWFAGAMKQ